MTLELTIDSLAFGGNGVGRHAGKAIFVPLTAPGDRIACRIVRDKGRYAEAELIEVLQPGAGRRPAPCPVFGQCGGCQWQHLDYSTQVAWKERVFSDQLSRGAKVPSELIRPLLEAPDQWHYRSRVQFKCHRTATGLAIGFFRRGSHFVIDLPSCPITDHRLNAILGEFRRWLPDAPSPDRIPQIDLAIDDQGQVRAVVHCLDPASERLGDFLRPLAQATGLNLFIQVGRKESLVPICGQDSLVILVDDPPLSLAYGPGGFAQVNLDQNRRMVEEVLGSRPWRGNERVLDLYCGMGNFSLPIARRVRSVVGIEDFAPALNWARRNARQNGLSNLDFRSRSAEGALSEIFPDLPPDLVILDPPRSGAFSVARELAKTQPQAILYVSCDPSTLARDLQLLLHRGYSLSWSRPIDLFPQTFHTESVTFLTRQT